MVPVSPQRLIFILAGPSGAGKNTLIKLLLERVNNIYQLPSITTRQRRLYEKENVHHLFVSVEEFAQHISEDQFVEWKIAYGHYYGTLHKTIETALRSDHDYIADIDIWGAIKIKEKHPRSVIIIFVRTSTVDILEQRLHQRGMLTDQEIEDRLITAQREIADSGQSDYIITNDDLDSAVLQLVDILAIERNRITIYPKDE